MTYRDAVRDALREALRRDPAVFLMGEDIGKYGGTYAVTRGLYDEFGPERVRDTPLSESAFVGAGIGAALGGMRPIVEIMTVNFSLLALDQIVNVAALLRHMSGGQLNVPLVIRMATGAGRQLAAQHSHSLENWYAHVPGLRVVAPATVADARGMLASALALPEPVIVFEHCQLYATEDESPTGDPVDLDRAAIRRPGNDATVITYGGSLPRARRRRPAREERHRGRGHRPARAPSARHARDPPVGRAHASRGGRRRGLEDRKPRRRARGDPCRARVLGPRRSGRARVHRGGADPLRASPRARGAAQGRGRRRRRPSGVPWLRSACRRSAPTWRPAR
jgi:hypothetical protein